MIIDELIEAFEQAILEAKLFLCVSMDEELSWGVRRSALQETNTRVQRADGLARQVEIAQQQRQK